MRKPRAATFVLASFSSILSLSFAACTGVRPINSGCEWPGEPSVRLDLHTGSHQRHLSSDARVAEELAIRHADVTRGRSSGHFTSVEEYRRTREKCFDVLSGEIATRHAISPAEVAGAVGRRDEVLDAIVLLVFAALYGLAANSFLRQLFVRFPPDEPWPALVGTVAGAIGVSATGLILGGLGASIVEMIQLGDTHMSYRADRLPWSRHWLLYYAGGLVMFAVIAIVRWRRLERPRQHLD